MHLIRLIGALALLVSTSASAALPVTTGESDTDGPPDTDGQSGTVTIVQPADNSVFPGTPDAVVEVIVEFSASVSFVNLIVDDDAQVVSCPVENQTTQCVADVTLSPGTHQIVALGTDNLDLPVAQSIPITVEVTAETATTGGPATDGSTGAPTGGSTGAPDGSTGGSDGSTGDSDGTGGSTPEKGGCDCDASGRPGPGLALLLGLVALGRRRNTR